MTSRRFRKRHRLANSEPDSFQSVGDRYCHENQEQGVSDHVINEMQLTAALPGRIADRFMVDPPPVAVGVGLGMAAAGSPDSGLINHGENQAWILRRLLILEDDDVLLRQHVIESSASLPGVNRHFLADLGFGHLVDQRSTPADLPLRYSTKTIPAHPASRTAPWPGSSQTGHSNS